MFNNLLYSIIFKQKYNVGIHALLYVAILRLILFLHYIILRYIIKLKLHQIKLIITQNVFTNCLLFTWHNPNHLLVIEDLEMFGLKLNKYE